LNEVDRFVSSDGNTIVLKTDESRWEVANLGVDQEPVWTEVSVSGSHPFTEEEARAEFERWRV
jgi:hypothetical protein